MKKNLNTFATFRLPNESDFYSVSSEDYSIQPEFELKENGFYISDFEQKNNLFIPLNNVLKNEFVTCKMILNDSPKEETKENYLQQIENITQEIQKKNYTKIVHSRVKLVDKQNDFDFKSTFKSLCDKYPTAFVYVFYSEKIGLWIGATPELLIKKKENNKYQTVSLAGTKTTNRNWTEKEIHEQQCVTDFIQKTLENKTSKIEISKAKDSMAGTLIHLKSNINFELESDNKLGNVIKTLHPTPAVCGIPQLKAKEYILKTENYNRDFYTGFLGFKNLYNQTNLFVNLRCMQVCKTNLALYIGGGIMANSIPEDEWNETENKAKTMLSIL